MFSGELITIDVAGAEEKDIDRFLDVLYLDEGYLTPEGTAPSWGEIYEGYTDERGYEPTLLACYDDAEGNPVVEPADWFSRRGKELIVQTRTIIWLGEAYDMIGLE